MRRDRLHQKGLLSRIESKDDRRIRVVALTAKGQRLIVPIFRKHAADIQQVFAEFSSDRLGRLQKRLEADW
jgi:DNA-binding MarR family transcriptional regulator